MNPKVVTKAREYTKKHPKKAALIKRAVKRGLKEYGETFKLLANS
ncbi:MAG: hypothetical protein Q7S44_02395 [bacterium]|nr:hypothetical protein [bacterium]